MNIKHSFPSVVLLPRAEIVEHQHLRIALGDPTRAVLSYWRRWDGFPRSYRSGRSTFTVTNDVANWLISRGVSVQRVR